MFSSIQRIIREFVAPEHRLSCNSKLWREGLAELKRRGDGRRESGAFLLGESTGLGRRILRFVFYDDLDPHSLDHGYVIFNGTYYSALWKMCRESNLFVVADIHTHPGAARQSATDKVNPMIPKVGHVAIIVPNFARELCRARDLGIYQYEGRNHWKEIIGHRAPKFFYIGFWS